MTSDDQFFFDYLSSVPNDIRRYSLDLADSIDRRVEHVAAAIREILARQPWLPSVIRSPLKEPRIPPPPQSVTNRIQNWILRHRAWAVALLVFVGTSGLLVYGSRSLSGRKRRARKAVNGARKEIVVLAGSPHEPITRSIATDLERRGFIVYITISSSAEEHVVLSENRSDIQALWLDLTTAPSTPSEIHPSLHAIHSLITQPQFPIPGVSPHTCQLTGLIILPSPNYPTGPVATIPPSSWGDTINTRLLSPILTTQIFLPLLTLRNSNSTIIFAYPSITSSLSSPFASAEIAITRALSGFATSLRRELRLLERSSDAAGHIDIVELKLGNIDLGSQYRQTHSHTAGTAILTWSSQQRALYGSSYVSNFERRPIASTGLARASSARELHYAVFDSLASQQRPFLGRRKRKQPIMYVGRGSWVYGAIGDWCPGSLVGWMLGLRSRRHLSSSWAWAASGSDSNTRWEKV